MKTLILIVLFPMVVFSAPVDKYTPTQEDWAQLHFDANRVDIGAGYCGFFYYVDKKGVKAYIHVVKTAPFAKAERCKKQAKRIFDIFKKRYSTWKWLKYSEEVKSVQ